MDKDNLQETPANTQSVSNDYLKEWGSVPGDLDDFIFYNEIPKRSTK